MKKVLFINSPKAKCSIWESGFMAYSALEKYSSHSFSYIEIWPGHSNIPSEFDIYLFNYHNTTMSWLDTGSLKQIKAFKATLVLEVMPEDALPECPRDVFDAHVILDPSFISKESDQYVFPRPLEEYAPKLQYRENSVPVIGSFGFATPGKGFHKVVEAVNNEFDKAVIRLNIPHGDFVPDSTRQAALIARKCRAAAKKGVKVIVTHDYLSKQELVDWCAANTLNCFLYDRPDRPGLAATVDQAVLAKRPLAVSDNITFRHVHKYLQPYPRWSLKDSMTKSLQAVESMALDWHPQKFAEKFDAMISENNCDSMEQDQAHYNLSVTPEILRESLNRALYSSANVSYAQAGEDRILAFLFQSILGIQNPSYIDIGANHPYSISNTYYFYQRGSAGVCLEPNPELHKLFSQARPRDICLNAAVGPEAGSADFYLFTGPNDGLSTFSQKEAEYWQKQGKKYTAVIKAKMLPLDAVIDIYLKKVPDFISLDVEGIEMSILSGFDFIKYPVQCFCIETLRYNDDNSIYKDSEIIQFMRNKDYMLYAETGINSIFLKQNTQ